MPPSLIPALHRRQPLRPLVALAFVVLAGLPGGTAGAAESTAGAAGRPSAELKRFDIPAGDAFTTLKRFSTQSGEQLIYKADTLEGIRTTAVAGRFTSLDALGRMLVRTELAVTQDAKTGTLAISRSASTGRPTNDSDATSSLSSSAKKKSPSP